MPEGMDEDDEIKMKEVETTKNVSKPKNFPAVSSVYQDLYFVLGFSTSSSRN